jgi:opacity protein-like surface antigen
MASFVMARRAFWYDAGMRRYCLVPLVSCLFLVLGAAPASADITAFLGRTATPSSRPAKGLAIGTGLLIVGFEFEFAATDEDLDVPSGVANSAPALKTFMFNGLLQTPVPIARMQFYGTAGGGIYRETLSTDPHNDATNFGTNIGGGVKISLAGPIRLRLDYRVFSFRGTPRHTNAQRVYAGINLKF